MNNRRHVHAVEWHSDQLVLLDQRKLPHEEVYVLCHTVEDVASAIKNMTVRGAPAIGIAAAFGAVLSARERLSNTGRLDESLVRINIIKDLDALAQARPTAVNLMWAVNQAREQVTSSACSLIELPDSLLALAKQIHSDDIANNQRMAGLACDLMAQITSGVFSIMTHCNAGSLATGGYGTALGVARMAWQRKLIDKVYADETRPWMQGSRLTAWELSYEGIPVSINIDSAAAWIMSKHNVKWIVVGADRIAANGDVANKIGTFQLAITAKYHDVKVMVVAPSSTVDLSIESGEQIEIEMRSEEEITHFRDHQIAPENVEAINPVFDVTPARLIDAIVTEKGIIEKPTRQKMLWVLS